MIEVPPTQGRCREKETDNPTMWLTPKIHRQLPVPVAYLEFLDLVFTGSIWALMTETEAFSGVSGRGRDGRDAESSIVMYVPNFNLGNFLTFAASVYWYGPFCHTLSFYWGLWDTKCQCLVGPIPPPWFWIKHPRLLEPNNKNLI